MPKIEFSSDMLSGFEVIDEQHRQIIAAVNKLYDFADDVDFLEVKPLLDQIIATAASHFGFEESLMKDANYNHGKAYQTIHKILVKRVSNLYAALEQGDKVLSDLREMLTNWLKYYVNIEAMTFIEDVAEHYNALPVEKREQKINLMLREFNL